jgi:hypothetical protein
LPELLLASSVSLPQTQLQFDGGNLGACESESWKLEVGQKLHVGDASMPCMRAVDKPC